MTRTAPPATRLLHAGLVVAALALPAAGADPVGPPIGKNGYKAHLLDGPQGDDVDDYVVSLFAGERLSAKVNAPFQSPLFPVLVLLDPDGDDRSADAGLPPKPLTKRVKLASFTADETGLWALRVVGQRDSEGPYTIRFAVKSPGKQKLKRLELGGALPASTQHAIEAVDGATLDVTVKTRGGGAVAAPVLLLGPNGAPVGGPDGAAFEDAVRVKKRTAKLKRLPLTRGDGTYVLTIDAGGDAAEYDLIYRVRPPSRPKGGTRKLPQDEPFLTPLGEGPIEGVAGSRVRLRGWNFSSGALPTVLFGSRRGAEVLVDPSGGFLDVTAPEPEALGPVPVSVTNPDGQGSVQDDHFHYVEPPVLYDVTDLEGVPARGDSVAGGRRLRLHGADFVTGQLVRFGRQGTLAIPFLHSDTEMDVTVPPGAAGFVKVLVFDAFGQEAESEFDFEYKVPATFDAAPYEPALVAAATATSVQVRGAGFEIDDVVLFDGEAVAAAFGGPNLLSFTVPESGDGTYAVAVRDRHGIVASGPSLRVKSPGSIDTVQAFAGPRLDSAEVSRHGGTSVRISGSRFHAADVVDVGGASAPVGSAQESEIVVTTPAGLPGTADVVVTDLLGGIATATAALRYAGAADATAERSPGGSATDDLSGVRGVIGDLDGDGDDDDLALLSNAVSPGTRSERLRVLLGDGGAFVDETVDAVPDAGSDTGGADDWRGTALGLGDVDGGDGPDLLVAGAWPDPDDVSELRVLTNDGYGAFALDEDAAPASLYRPALVAEDENDAAHTVFSARDVDGAPTVLALGDVDGDGDLDVVLGRDRPLSVAFHIDPAAVDLGVVPPYVSAADAVTYALDETRYSSATRILENRIDDSEGFVDVTESALPSAGKDIDATPLPALVARDLALSDLDGDDDLDLVMTWDDPTTVTAKGLSSSDTARLATRILINDGDGVFTDATSSWLPAGSSPEWYQADRLVLADLDDDGDDDLVLVHSVSLNEYLGIPPGGNRRALRVLRNDGDPAGAGSGFTDVSAAALPSVPIAGNDNLRGDALSVGDVTGDGVPDVLVGARTAPTNGGTALRALRLLVGAPGTVRFTESSAFLTPLSVDSGQCDDVLLVHDLAGAATPSIVLISESAPSTSPSGEMLRVWDWER